MATTYPQCRPRGGGRSYHRHPQSESSASARKDAVHQAEQDIHEGIASVSAALGDRRRRSSAFQDWRAQIDQYLASQKLMTWSADFPADDRTKITPAQVRSDGLFLTSRKSTER
jgi:hypothetical protein